MKKNHYILILLLACAALSTSLISPAIADDPLYQEGESSSPSGINGSGEFISTGDPDDAITGDKFMPDPGPGEEDELIGDLTGIDTVVDILVGTARTVALFF